MAAAFAVPWPAIAAQAAALAGAVAVWQPLAAAQAVAADEPDRVEIAVREREGNSIALDFAAGSLRAWIEPLIRAPRWQQKLQPQASLTWPTREGLVVAELVSVWDARAPTDTHQSGKEKVGTTEQGMAECTYQ